MTGFAASTENRVFADEQALAQSVAEWLCARAQAAGGAFAICLSGGSTPRRLYQRLAEPTVAARFPWGRVHWFWGDERYVPHGHPDSNYRMAREAFLAHVPVPAGNIHPIPTESPSPEHAAAAYEATLRGSYGAERLDPGRPLFDVTLLGIGEDGHTASLFPGDPALEEDRRWAVAVAGAPPRVTLTYPVLESSRDLAFLATGTAKRGILARVQAGEPKLPASRVQPVGRLHWFADRAAAAHGS
jgi:6-phosphogluconolactonase